MATVRRSRIAARPNVAVKNKKQDLNDQCEAAEEVIARRPHLDSAPIAHVPHPPPDNGKLDGVILLTIGSSGDISSSQDTEKPYLPDTQVHLAADRSPKEKDFDASRGNRETSVTSPSIGDALHKSTITSPEVTADLTLQPTLPTIPVFVHDLNSVESGQHGCGDVADNGLSSKSPAVSAIDPVMVLSCQTPPTSSRADESAVGTDIASDSQGAVDSQSSTSTSLSFRPRARIKARPNIVADALRGKQSRLPGACSNATTKQLQDSVEARKDSVDSEHVPAAVPAISKVIGHIPSGDPELPLVTVPDGASSAVKQGSDYVTVEKPATQEATKTPADPTVCEAANVLGALATPVVPKKRRPRRKVTNSSEPFDRSKMTMKELLYWNPTSNPMARSAAQPLRTSIQEAVSDENDQLPKASAAAAITDDDVNEDNIGDGTDSAEPVPQVMVGDDGQIIINESSLVIESAPRVQHTRLSEVAVEDHQNYVTSSSFRKRTSTKFWSPEDTAKFYKALHFVGSDFSLMSNLFPKRTRAELKNKFKKEEKINKKNIDLALQGELKFDAKAFSDSDGDDSNDTSSETTKTARGSSRKRKSGTGLSTTSSKSGRMSLSKASGSRKEIAAKTADEGIINADEVPRRTEVQMVECEQANADRANNTERLQDNVDLQSSPLAGHRSSADPVAYERSITVLPATDQLRNVGAGQLIFVVPDPSVVASSSGDQDVQDQQQQQVIHVYVVSPPD